MPKSACLILKPTFKKLGKSLGPVPATTSSDAWIGLTKLSRHSRTAASLYAIQFYGRRPIDTATLARNILETLTSAVSVLPPPGRPLSKESEQRLAKALRFLLKSTAMQLHIYLHNAHQAGLNKKGGRAEKSLSQAVRLEERAYLSALMKSRKLVLQADIAALRSLALHIAKRLIETTAPLLTRASATTSAKGDIHALQLSDTARRWIHLLAAAVIFSCGLHDTGRKAALQKSADACKKPARLDMRLNTALARVPATLKKTAKIRGKVNHVRYFRLPKKPFSAANLVGAGIYLLAPYKSLMRIGVVNGSTVWAVGKRTKFMGKPVFEIEFEGVGQHSKIYWEDFLADSLRSVYNLYPAALRMAWSFPDVRRKDAISDLVSRTKPLGKSKP